MLSTIGVRIIVGRVRTQSPLRGPSLIFVVQYLIDYSRDQNTKFLRTNLSENQTFTCLVFKFQMAWYLVTWYHGNQTTI